MAVTLEQVEKLREKADVSYEEAKAALEEAGGDLLDALILLERRGRTRPEAGRGASFTTRPGGAEEPSRPRMPVPTSRQEEQDAHRSRPGFWAQLKELLLAALDLLRHSTVNQFEVWRGGELMTSIPVLILILLVLLAFWISIPLMVVGLFFGCKYRFSGPDVDGSRAGQVVDQVSDAVRDAVDQVKDEFRRSGKKK